MRCEKILFGFFLMISSSCNYNKDPYANKLGIESSVIAEMDTANYTLIQWQDSVIDFGKIKAGDSVHLKYSFTNTGKTPLFIFNTRTSCGCTVTDFPKKPVMPGKSDFITVRYKSGTQTGEINKTIVVITNTKNNRNSNLVIRGIVQPDSKKNQ